MNSLVNWKEATDAEKPEFEKLARGGSGWRRLDPAEFPRLVGGYREKAAYGVAIVEGSTSDTGTRSDCTVVTFVGNRPEPHEGVVDQDVWVTAVHSTGMHTKVAEIQHPDYQGRTRSVSTDFWCDSDRITRLFDPLPEDRNRGPLSEIEGTVYERALENVRQAASSARTDW